MSTPNSFTIVAMLDPSQQKVVKEAMEKTLQEECKLELSKEGIGIAVDEFLIDKEMAKKIAPPQVEILLAELQKVDHTLYEKDPLSFYRNNVQLLCN